MKADVKVITGTPDGMELKSIEVQDVTVGYSSVLSIDGSTSITGVAILRKTDGAVQYIGAFKREDGESPVHYKVRLKEAIRDILLRNKLIEAVFYEEPFIGYASSVKNLMMLRTFVEEIIIENEMDLSNLIHKEIPNKKWKRLFLAPDKVPVGTENEKAAVRKKLLTSLPFMESVTQDEIDATAMGFIATVLLNKGEEDGLEAKKKIKPFKFKTEFIGSDVDEVFLQDFMALYNGPKSILDNGLTLRELKTRESFEKALYTAMGQEDKVVILKFSSNTHGNLILEHKLGAIASEYDYIYAICYRVSRKR